MAGKGSNKNTTLSLFDAGEGGRRSKDDTPQAGRRTKKEPETQDSSPRRKQSNSGNISRKSYNDAAAQG